MTFVDPQYLVETDWLETHLTNPDLRVLDCTVLSDVDRRWPYLESGHETWAQSHIPSSGFVDLMSELADQESPLPFMMPPATQFAGVMSRYGVGDGACVVLYAAAARASRPRATRRRGRPAAVARSAAPTSSLLAAAPATP